MNDDVRLPSDSRTRGVVLVTGGCGYIGSQLICDLAKVFDFGGAAIRILDNMQRGGYQALMDLPEKVRYEFVEGDILDPATVRRALEGVETVVHLAAVVRTPFSFDDPTRIEQVNHWGTARLVEQCLEVGATRFLFVGSTSVYGPGGPYDERSVCRPVGGYGQSKWRAEQAVLAAADRGLRPTILRMATVFGLAPTMRFDAVANRFAYLAGVDRPLVVYGTGEQSRPLIHVRDASAAIRFCLTRAEKTCGKVFNVVGKNVSVLDLARVVKEVKPDVRVHHTEQDVLNHLSLMVDSRKFERLGWKPECSLEHGMAEVITRFKHLASLPADLLTIADI